MEFGLMSKTSDKGLAQYELTLVQHDVLSAVQVCHSKGFPATLDLIQVRTGYPLAAISDAVNNLVHKHLIRSIS
jgi:hypothetical protein